MGAWKISNERLTVRCRWATRAQAVTGSEDVSEEEEEEEEEETTADDAEDEETANSDAEEATGNYFGRAAAAPPAPEGANPFASSFSAAPEDDVAAMIRAAKAQVEEQRKSREIQEAKEREKERKAFEDQGREYQARRKAGDVSESSPASSSGARRKVVKAKRPGQSPLGVTPERAPATGGANPFAGFAALTGGAKTTTEEAPRSSVFSRLSGAPTAADDDENASKGDDEKKSPVASAPVSVEPAKPAAFGFFAPPPALTKENADTQRTLKSIPKEDDDDERDAPKPSNGSAVKKVKTALAIELGL